ncbi:hypothetical protein PGB90_001524 [Kerria lacca]
MPESLSSSKQSLQQSNFLSSRCILAQVTVALCGTIMTINLSAMTSTITIVNGVLLKSESSFNKTNNNSEFSFNKTNNNSTNSDNFPITSAEASLYGTLQLIVHFIAGVLSGIIQDKFGRRNCLLVSILPQICSWIMLYYAVNVYCLYVHAILIGLSTAFSEQTIITYVGEISNVKLRGRLFSIGKLGYGFGSFLIFLLNSFLSWRKLALVTMVLPLFTMFYILCLPESPIWLLSKGRVNQCRKSLRWLNGWTTDVAIEQEFTELQNYVNESNKFGVLPTNKVQSKITRKNAFQQFNENYLKLFFQPEFIQPYKIVMVIFVSSYFLSLRPAKFYFINILKTLEVPATDQTKIMSVSSLCQMVGSITLAFTIRKFGKRWLILWTFTITGLGLFLFGVYSYAHFHYKFSAIWILYIACGLNYYFAGYTLGGMPWFITAEIFPQKIRGVAGGITGTSAHIIVSILTQSYLFIEKLITVKNVFFTYAIISFLCIVYIYKNLPETENKSLQEIEEYFKNKNKNRNRNNLPIN